MNIAEITMPEFTSGLERSRTIFLPFGSTEEHGHHLPLDTDTMQVYAVVREAARLRPAFVAPPLHYGICRSTSEHPGTVGISPDTFRALVRDLIKGYYKQGLRNFILISGHAGKTHIGALIEVGEEMLAHYPDIRVAVINEYDFCCRAGRQLIATAGDSHAGEVETARIMHLFPELVKGSSPREFPAFPEFILVRDKQACWPGGVWGDPAPATAAQGAELCRLSAAALAAFVVDFENFSEAGFTGETAAGPEPAAGE
ncbi:MAG: creatininase family protein [Deltaproteobacteria bacterium]|nr:creatininase family protein [Deltaproteobacteria bacterium]